MAVINPPPNTSAHPLDTQHGIAQAAKSATRVVQPAATDPVQPKETDGGELAVSDALRVQIRSFASAERRANEVIAMAQTAAGALRRMGGLLERMRDLAQAAPSGDGGEEAILEFSQLHAEADGIRRTAAYDGRPLLGAEEVEVSFEVLLGDATTERLALALGGLAPLTVLTAGTEPTGVPARATDGMVGRIDEALSAIADRRTRFGAAVTRFADTAAALQTARTNRTVGEAPIAGADAAEEVARMTRAQILGGHQAAISTQANQLPAHAMSLLRD